MTYHLLNDVSDEITKEFLPTDRTYNAVNLDPMSYYEFSVAAQTALGWGYVSKGVVYTTDNREAPQAPSAPQISPSQVQLDQINMTVFFWHLVKVTCLVYGCTVAYTIKVIF